MKKRMSRLCVVPFALVIAAPVAFAGTKYYLYERDGNCEIDTRPPDKFNSQRGSDWTNFGSWDYRMDAMKKRDELEEKGVCKK